VDGVRRLRHDEYVGAHGLQQIAMGVGQLEFFLGRALQQRD
jgi:hypothetical protein